MNISSCIYSRFSVLVKVGEEICHLWSNKIYEFLNLCQCVNIKGLLQSEKLENMCLPLGLKNCLYKTVGKCDNRQQFKAIIEAAMVSTPEGCTNNSLMTHNPYVSTKKSIAIKSLPKFTETFNVKHNNTVCRYGAAKAN